MPPRMQGVVNRRGSRGSLEADSRFMGDNYGRALGAAISKSRFLSKMVLSRNSLTDKSASSILSALKAEHQLVELDLSYNPGLGRESYALLASYLENSGSGLRILRLEGNSAGDKLT